MIYRALCSGHTPEQVPWVHRIRDALLPSAASWPPAAAAMLCCSSNSSAREQNVEIQQEVFAYTLISSLLKFRPTSAG